MRQTVTLLLSLSVMAASAWAQTAPHGTIHPMGFPLPMGPTAQTMTDLYNIIFIIIAAVALVVALPIGYILWRFRQKNVRQAATFSHSTTLELLWTAIPAAICLFILWASYHALIKLRTMPDGATNIEVVAYQFGWDFYYPDASEAGTHVKAEAPTKPDAQLSRPGADRLVPELVVPAGKPVVLHVTSADVIHSFYNPSLGVKIDAIPGRINYAWFQANQPGTYLGQCAELCGSAHAEMFFHVRAVPQAEYEAYLKARRVDAGLPADRTSAPSPTVVVSGTSPIVNAVAKVLPGVSGTVKAEPMSAPVPVSNVTTITPSVPAKSTGTK